MERPAPINGRQRRPTASNGSILTSGFAVSAGQGVVVTWFGGQGVAGSNPVVPTQLRRGVEIIGTLPDSEV